MSNASVLHRDRYAQIQYRNCISRRALGRPLVVRLRPEPSGVGAMGRPGATPSSLRLPDFQDNDHAAHLRFRPNKGGSESKKGGSD